MKTVAFLLFVCLFGFAVGQVCHEPNVDESGGEATLGADVCEMRAVLEGDSPDFEEALDIYVTGRKTDDETLEEAALKEFACPSWKQFEDFFGGGGWMDKIMKAALAGEAPFENDTARVKAILAFLPGTVLNGHAIYHFERALIDLGDEDPEAAVFQWDLGMAAFYGTDVSCAGFGNGLDAALECTTFSGNLATTVTSIAKAIKSGRDGINEGDQDALSAAVGEIIKEYKVIYVQSVVAYLTKMMGKAEAGDPFTGMQAAGYAFLHSILPYVSECDKAAGDSLVEVLTPGATPDAEEIMEALGALASTYECVGITEEDVGTCDGEKSEIPDADDTCYNVNPFEGFVA